MTSRISERGFSLLEVMVALLIVAIALAACVRAAGLMATQNRTLSDRRLALQSADNMLAELQLERSFPSIGIEKTHCTQGRRTFVCERSTAVTPNTDFREITIRVQALPGGQVLAELRGLVAEQP